MSKYGWINGRDYPTPLAGAIPLKSRTAQPQQQHYECVKRMEHSDANSGVSFLLFNPSFNEICEIISSRLLHLRLHRKTTSVGDLVLAHYS